MALKITKENDYILVEPSIGMVYWDILKAIPNVLLMPEFKDKNDIWLFREGQMKILYTDLHSIRDVAEKLHPNESKGKKTAIVVGTGFQKGLASMYADIGKDLPREIKVFSDLKSAEEWIKK